MHWTIVSQNKRRISIFHFSNYLIDYFLHIDDIHLIGQAHHNQAATRSIPHHHQIIYPVSNWPLPDIKSTQRSLANNSISGRISHKMEVRAIFDISNIEDDNGRRALSTILSSDNSFAGWGIILLWWQISFELYFRYWYLILIYIGDIDHIWLSSTLKLIMAGAL